MYEKIDLFGLAFVLANPIQSLDVALLDKRLGDKPVFAFYSKIRQRKDEFVRMLMEHHPNEIFVYLCPKIVVNHIKSRFPNFMVVPIEHFTQKETFLHINSLANPKTVIIMENVSRYTHLSSDKFNCLHRLRMATEKRYLIDIVPFTKAIHKLYLPYSYLDREILQYSHGWAFEYNYLEEDDKGNIRHAHDLDFLAEKLSPWCYLDYQEFLPLISYINSELTPGEVRKYQARKTDLFDTFDNPVKIVTELCDCANMMQSRYNSLVDLLGSLRGNTVLFTNIVKNNALLKRYLRDYHIEYRTYMTHNNQPIRANNVILFETPINQNQMNALDVLADIQPDCETYLFRNNAKADTYIFNLVDKEWQAINGLTKELWRAQCASI